MARDLVHLLATWVMLLGSALPIRDACSRTPPRYSSYEVIVPRRLEPQGEGAKKNELCYIIKAAGTDHILRLKHKENFLVKDLPVFTYDTTGRQIQSHPYIPAECYYEGYVEGLLDSLVVLSTCFGLRGFLKIKDLYYGIEPLKGSSAFQHLLYLTEGVGPNASICGMGVEDAKDQAKELGTRQVTFEDQTRPMSMELYIVVDNEMFLREGRNKTMVLHTVLEIVNLVDVYYHQLHAHVPPVGLEIWTNGNHISISDNITEVLDSFNSWRKNYMDKQVKYDFALLLVHKHFDEVPAKTYPNAICNPEFSAGVVAYTNLDRHLFSKTVAHLLGHSIGINHDGPNCVCDKGNSCMMHSYHPKSNQFSNCSMHTYFKLLMSDNITCLTNVPDFYSVLTFKDCGNGVVDSGEDCDCGDAQSCKENPCCYPNCTFKPEAYCAIGSCCYDCDYRPTGTLCRDKVGECDLPEYCSGDTGLCPKDLHVQDGTPCANQKAYCYAKSCLTHRVICTAIYGQGVEVAPRSCFEVLNTAGNQYGNCGGDGKKEKFVECKRDNVLCGRAQCVNIKTEPTNWKYITFIQTQVENNLCWSVGFPSRTDTVDIGVIPDGTRCGKEKICMNRTCISTSLLKTECDPKVMCHGRGICNNLHHCHCNLGWAPPNCWHIGIGGSIDSGSPLRAWLKELLKTVFCIVMPLTLVAVSFIIWIVPKRRLLLRQFRQRISRRCRPKDLPRQTIAATPNQDCEG